MLSGAQPKGDNMTTKQGQDEAGAGLKAVKVLPTPEADNNVKVDVQARFALRPSVHAATVVRDYGKAFGDLDLSALTLLSASGVGSTFTAFSPAPASS